MTRVLLLGASGFLGRHIHQALRGDPRVETVICLGRRNRPVGAEAWIQHDLISGSAAELEAILRETRPDAVVGAVGSLVGSGPYLVEANILLVAKLLEAMQVATPGARLVKLGSAGEYGSVTPGLAVNEESPPRPVSIYGITRLASTQLVALAKAEGRLDGVVLRVFNPIGAGMGVENMLGRAAAQMVEARASGRDYIEMGPLGAYRDYVDVRDVARAVVDAVLALRPPSAILNVGSGRAVQNRELIQILAAVAGFQGEIREGRAAPARSAGVSWIQADITRIAQELGWKPVYSLRNSVEYLWSGVAAARATS
ncbi:MAG: NAD(P)-dependent oxidoreductase [Thermaceae bacterium]|nr:NAD(P)-dependent oxidoreductase [Thermaceae bacterium]